MSIDSLTGMLYGDIVHFKTLFFPLTFKIFTFDELNLHKHSASLDFRE